MCFNRYGPIAVANYGFDRTILRTVSVAPMANFELRCRLRNQHQSSLYHKRPYRRTSHLVSRIDEQPQRYAILLVTAVITALVASPVDVRAQELNCGVSVDYRALSGSDYTYLDEFRDAVREYMNLQRWTDDAFEDFERIDCTLQITFLEAISLTRFRAKLVIASRRPIYGTTQSSVILQINDEDWTFNYPQGQPLTSDQDRFDELTTVLDFYAYIILGYDYDTFAEFGGSPLFERARRISDIAKTTGGAGWQQIGSDRSRVKLITEVLDPRFRNLRKVYFDYHFNGLDRFVQETELARGTVLASVEELSRIVDANARSYVVDLFFSGKYLELISIFEQSALASQAFDLLSELDPARISNYNTLIQ